LFLEELIKKGSAMIYHEEHEDFTATCSFLHDLHGDKKFNPS